MGTFARVPFWGRVPFAGAICRRVEHMAWIRMIGEDEAEGRLAEMYRKTREPWGGVDNILKIHSLNAPSLEAHFQMYKVLMRGKSDLSKAQREMIAVAVSALNQCVY